MKYAILRLHAFLLVTCCMALKTQIYNLKQSSVKEIFEIVKVDRSLILDACDEVNKMISMNKLQTAKEAMNAINIFKLAGDVSSAISLLKKLQSDTSITYLDTGIFNNIIDLCAKQGNVTMAVYLLQSMEKLKIPMDKISFGSALSACANSGQWQISLKLLDQMRFKQIQPDTICFSSAISACSRSGRIKEALQLLQTMKNYHIKTDAIVYNSILVACSNTGDYELTMYILHVMKRDNIARDAYTYTAAITAYDKASRYDLIRKLVEDMFLDKISDNLVPYNTAIYALPVNDGLKIFKRMLSYKMIPNTNTYASLIGSLGKENNHRLVIELTNEMKNKGIPINPTIYKSVILACEKLNEFYLAWDYFSTMRQEGYIPSTMVYNSIITCRGHTAGYHAAKDILNEMKRNEILINTVTYNNLIATCRSQGLYVEAMSLLREMIEMSGAHLLPSDYISLNDVTSNKDSKDDNNIFSADRSTVQSGVSLTNETVLDESNIISLSSSSHHTVSNSINVTPDTVTYSACISVCIESKQWELALELLQEMEAKNIPRNIVTYNTVIEALTNAGETVRSELVYQSAIRAGVYNHWHPIYPSPLSANNPFKEYYMDFHHFPAAVARAAIMHVLGEICTKVIPLPSRLVIITGKGNHQPTTSRSAVGKKSPYEAAYELQHQRGILSKDLQLYLQQLGLNATYDITYESTTDQTLSTTSISGKNVVKDKQQLTFTNRLADRLALQTNTNKYGNTMKIKNVNKGRLVITNTTIETWLNQQIEDDAQRRAKGMSAHGNIFLQVAYAKNRAKNKQSVTINTNHITNKKTDYSTVDNVYNNVDTVVTNTDKVELNYDKGLDMNIRAVCPFSSATTPKYPPVMDIVSTPDITTEMEITSSKNTETSMSTSETISSIVTNSTGKCPAHATTTVETTDAVSSSLASTGSCPAHATTTVETTDAVSSSLASTGKCPAHATTTIETTDAVSSSLASTGNCPAHATTTVETTDAVSSSIASTGKCSAHTTTTIETTDAVSSSLASTGKCPAHATTTVETTDAVSSSLASTGNCPAHATTTVETTDAVSSSIASTGKCPAHATTTIETTDAVSSSPASTGKCPAHATTTVETTDAVSSSLASTGNCPAHVTTTVDTTDAVSSSLASTGNCPAHVTTAVDTSVSESISAVSSSEVSTSVSKCPSH